MYQWILYGEKETEIKSSDLSFVKDGLIVFELWWNKES